MCYSVREIYYSLQGEGAHAGRPAVFLRFSGCNLWSGRDDDRPSAVCRFCDTDFVGTDGPGGGRFDSPDDLAKATLRRWPSSRAGAPPFVVCTGGEPLLQLDARLTAALKGLGFEIAVETNGTLPVPAGIDWICVSPKTGADLVQTAGDELKLVFPQPGCDPADYERLAFRHFFLQPMDGPNRDENTRRAVRYCLERPQWRLSLQMQKTLGIP